jgi:hypothetical protein
MKGGISMKTTNTNTFANVDFGEMIRNAPVMSVEDLDNFEFNDIETREISEDEVPEDIRKNASKGIAFEIGGKAKSVISKTADVARNLSDNVELTDLATSIISSIICLVYTSVIEKKWQFDKHNKLVNFLCTGCTKPEHLRVLAPVMKAYNAACIVITVPFTVVAIIKKLRK